MFDIKFTSNLPRKVYGEEVLDAEIVIGSFSEQFTIPIGFWTKKDYINQWCAAAESLLNEPFEASTALLTSMYEPQSVNFLFSWILYKTDKTIYVQNSILNLDGAQKFELENLNSYIPDRETETDEGQKISEWEISQDDLKGFIKSCYEHIE